MRGNNEPEFREIAGKEGDEGRRQCDVCPQTSVFSSIVRPYEIGNESD